MFEAWMILGMVSMFGYAWYLDETSGDWNWAVAAGLWITGPISGSIYLLRFAVYVLGQLFPFVLPALKFVFLDVPKGAVDALIVSTKRMQ